MPHDNFPAEDLIPHLIDDDSSDDESISGVGSNLFDSISKSKPRKKTKNKSKFQIINHICIYYDTIFYQ